MARLRGEGSVRVDGEDLRALVAPGRSAVEAIAEYVDRVRVVYDES